MPIWLRTFTYNSLKKYYDEQAEQQENQINTLSNKNSSKAEVARPNIAPNPGYVTKAAPKK